MTNIVIVHTMCQMRYFCGLKTIGTIILSKISMIFSVPGHSGKIAIVVNRDGRRRCGNNSRGAGADGAFDEYRYDFFASGSRLHRLHRGRFAKETEPVVLATQRSAYSDLELEGLFGSRQY